MLNLQLDYQRMTERRRLSGLLPGKMLHVGSERFVSARAVDVTSQGIGILSSHHLNEGDEVLLTVRGSSVELVVHYKKRDYAKSSRFRYGLILKESSSDHDLMAIFESSGCFLL